MLDEKYVVFKLNDVQGWVTHLEDELGIHLQDIFESRLEDAVVIRTQDMFAAAGLTAYANNIRVYTGALNGLIPDLPPEKRAGAQAMVDRLMGITGYFMDCAQEAEDRLARGDVKVPD